jgi:hypothetical protein
MISKNIYIFIALRSHVHVSDVTNLLIFWIKLLLKLPKFLTLYVQVFMYVHYFVTRNIVRTLSG